MHLNSQKDVKRGIAEMSDLEGRTMIKDMKELEDDYRILLDEYSKYPKLDASLRVNNVLEELRYAGRYISRPQYREKLADWCRNLGRIVYGLTGDFPTMRIFPFEIREALTGVYKILMHFGYTS